VKFLTVYVKNLLLLVGDGDQILLPYGWSSDWIKEIRDVPSKYEVNEVDKKKVIMEQIKIVIDKLEIEYTDEINSGIMQLIYKRYKNALNILENNKDIKQMNIIGGVRAYMDSYSDYNNPILGELYKTEKLIKNLYESECKINNK